MIRYGCGRTLVLEKAPGQHPVRRHEGHGTGHGGHPFAVQGDGRADHGDDRQDIGRHRWTHRAQIPPQPHDHGGADKTRDRHRNQSDRIVHHGTETADFQEQGGVQHMGQQEAAQPRRQPAVRVPGEEGVTDGAERQGPRQQGGCPGHPGPKSQGPHGGRLDRGAK